MVKFKLKICLNIHWQGQKYFKHQVRRVNNSHFTPLTESYVGASYTAPVYSDTWWEQRSRWLWLTYQNSHMELIRYWALCYFARSTYSNAEARSRFTFAIYSSLPIASFSPHRYQKRSCGSDCLFPDLGDASFALSGFARAYQAKKSHRLKRWFLKKLQPGDHCLSKH